MIQYKQRLKYYRDFFNNNFFRELRIMGPYTFRRFIKEDNIRGQASVYSLMNMDTGHNNIYSEIYGFKDWEEFKKNVNNIEIKKSVIGCNRPSRVYDRLYFDFDYSTPFVDDEKDAIQIAIKEKNWDRKERLVGTYQRILSAAEIAEKPFEELKKLYNYLCERDIKSYPVFSGSKGFHLYIFFPDHLFDCASFNNVAIGIFNNFRDNLKLETLDEKVFQNPSHRIARLPYARHPISELYCYPININDSYKEIIEKSFNPEIVDLNFNSYVENAGNINFSNKLKELIEIEKQKIKELKKYKSQKRKAHAKKYKNVKRSGKNVKIGSLKNKINDPAIKEELLNNMIRAGYIHGNMNHIGFRFVSLFRKGGLTEDEIYEIFKSIPLEPHDVDGEVRRWIYNVFKGDINYIAGFNSLKEHIEESKYVEEKDKNYLINWFKNFFNIPDSYFTNIQ